MTSILKHQGIKHESPFDSIRHFDEQGKEFWTGRELQSILGYVKWQKFKSVIENAIENLETVSDSAVDHFLPRWVKTNGRQKLDYRLSRLAVDQIMICSDSRTSRPRSKSESERSVQVSLAATIDGAKIEIQTLAGNIDILTPVEIIEVKKVCNWKSAVGQVLIYGHYYPNHSKRIHLYGEIRESFLGTIKTHCKKLEISVTWQP